jgi:2-polyprenyl-3-methyl-5-hydroxy-6-metoxy-1,4-benzoquinol methylase
MKTQPQQPVIRTSRQLECPICGSQGTQLYTDLEDRLFGVAGRWGHRQCSDPSCGLIWLDPAPCAEDLHLAYQSYYTHQIAETPQHVVRNLYGLARDGYLQIRFGYNQGVGAPWQRLLAPLVVLHPGGRDAIDAEALFLPAPQAMARALDIGCGNGSNLRRMSELGWQMEGLDVDPIAIKQLQQQGLNAKLGSLFEQDYPDQTFQAIYMSHVIEHVADPIALLQECWRVLVPGGQLVLITPNMQSLGRTLLRSAWIGIDPPRHLLLYTQTSLTCLLKATNFTISRMSTTARGAKGILMVSWQVQRFDQKRASLTGYEQIVGMGAQFIERLLLKVHPDIGEELIAIGQKPA